MTQEAPGEPTTRNDEAQDRQAAEQGAAGQQAAGRETAGQAIGEEADGEPGARAAGEQVAGERAGQQVAGQAGGAERPEARLEKAVRAAEQALIEFEIAVETFRVEVENFSRLHHEKLGPMYARLDELDAQLAEARAGLSGDPEDLRKADELRALVMPMPGVEELFHDWMDSDGLSPEASAMLTGQAVQPPKRVRPSEEARKLYRELARKAHPDLAQDEPERERRDEFITRVNAAYGRGDVAQLKQLAAEWAAGPVPAEQPPSESEELYARLEWLSRRKELLSLMAQELEESAIGAMLRMAPDDPDRLLEEIAEQLLAQVSEREQDLAKLVQ
ncbi:J domain-containing protein [Streptomyces sp. 21So2-11]|uniref:J domain-containing protein n=1 Tax=Streptomyces sp. 21So2-11 TaxID=3144408 RepID=UPI00321AC5DE